MGWRRNVNAFDWRKKSTTRVAGFSTAAPPAPHMAGGGGAVGNRAIMPPAIAVDLLLAA